MSAGERGVVVVGGGIVGLATARALVTRAPGLDVVLLEKESGLAEHQTGRNSGVVHRGVYYAPGSQKAELCGRGAAQAERYCLERGLPYRAVGKVIVATSVDELPRLDRLEERARANGVPGLERIGAERLRELEPHVAGVAALHSPQTAVTDWAAVARSFAREAQEGGVEIRLEERFLGCRADGEGERVETDRGDWRAAHVLLCSGLWAHHTGAAAGLASSERILPFRGEYAQLRDARTSLVNGLVYPVPDPRFPFLGVHFTRSVGGGVDVGPSAVLATTRDRRRSFDLRTAWEVFSFPGTWRLGAKHLGLAAGEFWRARRRAAFVHAAARLVPELTAADLVSAPSGLRAQLVDRRGHLVDDFEIRTRGRVTSVLNAPSPAATSSLAIAELLAERVLGGKKVPGRGE